MNKMFLTSFASTFIITHYNFKI